MSSDPRIPPTGDPFTSAPAPRSTAEEKHLAKLEERQQLRDQVLRLRHRLRLSR